VFESWLLNALNILLPTIAVLLIFLSQRRMMRMSQAFGANEQRQMFERQHNRVSIAMALLALWLVVQYVALIVP
jgi:preprotein translocase subunit SecG